MKPTVALTHSDEIRVEPYITALKQAGLEVLAWRPGAEKVPEAVGGLVLAGGVDVDPALYGQHRAPETEEPNPERDRMELQILRLALARKLPVLGICRGLQLVNVGYGGTLHQHLAQTAVHQLRPKNLDEPAHTIRTEPDSLLAGIFGPQAWVNSRHHQAVDRVGSGLRVSARAPDLVVEGIEHTAYPFLVGVQWHPEDQVNSDPAQARLFETFATRVMASLYTPL